MSGCFMVLSCRSCSQLERKNPARLINMNLTSLQWNAFSISQFMFLRRHMLCISIFLGGVKRGIPAYLTRCKEKKNGKTNRKKLSLLLRKLLKNLARTKWKVKVQRVH